MKTVYGKPLKVNNTNTNTNIFSTLFGTKATSFKDTLLNNTAFKKYPYMKYPFISSGGFPASAVKTYTTTSIYPKSMYMSLINTTPVYYNPGVVYINTYDDYLKNLVKLQDLLYYAANPTYDFKLADGTPVKIDSNYIQIGNKLIPMSITKDMFNSLSTATKTAINDIFVLIDSANNVTVYTA